MEEQALALRDSGGPLATVGGLGLEGMEGLGAADLIIPRYELLQPVSRKQGNAGQFHLNLTKECVDEVRAVILRVSNTRVLWSGAATDKAPECTSGDGVQGSLYGACLHCRFNRFPDPKAPPTKICKGGYTYLCSSPDNPEDLFLISLYGMSATPAKKLNTVFATKRRPPFTAITIFRSQGPISNDKGKFYVIDPVVETGNWLKEEQWLPFREMSRSMKDVAIREVEPLEDQENSIGDEINQAADEIAAEEAARKVPPTVATVMPVEARPGGRDNAPTEMEEEREAMWAEMGAAVTPPSRPVDPIAAAKAARSTGQRPARRPF